MNIDENVSIEKKLLEVAVALTAEKDCNRLLEKIVSESRSITNADGGTLYLVDKNFLYLHHRIMQTKSLGIFKGAKGEYISFSPLDMSMRNVSSYCALTEKVINIPDVYDSDVFDFSGPRDFDETTGYRTSSMLVFPLISRQNKVVGVLQLINAKDREGNVIPFDPKYEDVVRSLASQAGISIENMQYLEQVRALFESFVKAIAKTIDERTPYNSKHSKSLSILISSFARYLNTLNKGPFAELTFSDAAIYELETATWLHDIGKIVVPLEVLDKPTRLAHRFKPLMDRYDLIIAKLERDRYKALAENPEVSVVDFEDKIDFVTKTKNFLSETNKVSVLVDDQRYEELKGIHQRVLEGVEEPLLTDDELEHLSIYRGTLTPNEREMVKEHVNAGARILENLAFPDYLENMLEWIKKHHEFLDGSGYPEGLEEKDIPIPSRMMTIVDIFDALVERNRPYKDAMPKDKAIEILKGMAEDNKLDSDLVNAFADSDVWKISLDD